MSKDIKLGEGVISFDEHDLPGGGCQTPACGDGPNPIFADADVPQITRFAMAMQGQALANGTLMAEVPNIKIPGVTAVLLPKGMT